MTENTNPLPHSHTASDLLDHIRYELVIPDTHDLVMLEMKGMSNPKVRWWGRFVYPATDAYRNLVKLATEGDEHSLTVLTADSSVFVQIGHIRDLIDSDSVLSLALRVVSSRKR